MHIRESATDVSVGDVGTSKQRDDSVEVSSAVDRGR
jgi:hypothetical protein